MAYQMSPPPAQQPLKPPPQPYPPYQAAGSPGAQSPFAQPPPAKRQRLSPDPRSPAGGSPMYAQSPMHYTNLNGAQSASPLPYSPQSYVGSPQNSFNTPQPYSPPVQWPVQQPQPQQRPTQISPPPPPSSNSMPPPPRPNKEDKDENTRVEDIGDSLFGSGINLKDEENYLHNTWNNRHSQQESFNTTQSTSFGSSTMSPNNSFNLLTQGTSFSSSGQEGAFAGSMGQPRSQEDIENDLKRKREHAARKRAEKDQFHLNNQFLQTNCLRHRMHQQAAKESVRLNVEGVYVRDPEVERAARVMVSADGTEGIVVATAKPEAMIEQNSPYEHILTLVSLASAERLRGLVDEAYGLARARKYGDHGRVVPPEFSDIATGEGQQSQETVVPESITGSQWERPETGSAIANGTQVNGESSTPTPQPTISFQGTLNQQLRDLAERDRQAEKERLKKREARKRKAENAAEDTPAATPAEEKSAEPLAAVAPVKVSKKEQNKKAKEAQATTEAQALKQSNSTAAMMAFGGSKKNRYAWMSGGAANMPTNRFAKPGGGTATPRAAEPVKGPADAAKKDDEKKKLPTWGDWREDDVNGKGIQLRDWILVLERDGREKKALQKAVNKLS